MNQPTPRSLPGRAIAIAAIAVVIHIWTLHPSYGAVAQDPPRPPHWKAMIDALANSNPEPKLVEQELLTVPLFVPNYDWREQRRARIALVALIHEESPELWEKLVEHARDKRYALTMAFDGGSAINYTVGDLCRMLAYERVSFVDTFNSDPKEFERPNVHLDLGIEDLPKWRKERSAKSLYELQVEVCETALKEVRRLDKIPRKAKDRISKEIQSKLNQLRKAKKPLFFTIPLDAYDSFNAESAAKIRKDAKKEK